MAKKKKLTKEEVSGPDAFQSLADKASKFLSDNKQAFASVIAVFVIGGIGMVGYSTFQNAAEEAAQTELYPGLKELADIQREMADLENPAPEITEEGKEKPKPVDPIAKEKKMGELDAKIESKTKSLLSKIEAHKGTHSAQVATLNLSGYLINQEKYEQAKGVLESLLSEIPKGSANYGVARSQLASVLSYTGESDKAISYLQEILADTSLTFMHGDALVKLGILHFEKSDLNKARTNLLRAKTEFSSLTSGRLALQYLRWMDYKNPSVPQVSQDEKKAKDSLTN